MLDSTNTIQNAMTDALNDFDHASLPFYGKEDGHRFEQEQSDPSYEQGKMRAKEVREALAELRGLPMQAADLSMEIQRAAIAWKELETAKGAVLPIASSMMMDMAGEVCDWVLALSGAGLDMRIEKPAMELHDGAWRARVITTTPMGISSISSIEAVLSRSDHASWVGRIRVGWFEGMDILGLAGWIEMELAPFSLILSGVDQPVNGHQRSAWATVLQERSGLHWRAVGKAKGADAKEQCILTADRSALQSFWLSQLRVDLTQKGAFPTSSA